VASEGQLFDPGTPPPTDETHGNGARPDFIQAQATVFRWADYDTPVWARANNGRWHRAGAGHSVQYWAYSPEAAWAESLRAQGIREVADIETMRSKIWVGQICMSDIAVLTDPRWQLWLGITADALVSDDWSACQDAADTLRAVGANGVVAPSAALTGRLNLIVFKRMVRGDWVESPEGARTLRYPDIMLPCQLIARGRPPVNLRESVNYRPALPA
jgi:RES domain-containing protein